MAFWLVVEPPGHPYKTRDIQSIGIIISFSGTDCLLKQATFRPFSGSWSTSSDLFLPRYRTPSITQSIFCFWQQNLLVQGPMLQGCKFYAPCSSEKKHDCIFSDEIHSSKTKHRKNTRPNTQVVCRQILLWVVKRCYMLQQLSLSVNQVRVTLVFGPETWIKIWPNGSPSAEKGWAPLRGQIKPLHSPEPKPWRPTHLTSRWAMEPWKDPFDGDFQNGSHHLFRLGPSKNHGYVKLNYLRLRLHEFDWYLNLSYEENT